MNWIKVRDDLRYDPAVVLIAARLDLTTRHVVGCLIDVWTWAGKLTQDGFIPFALPALLDEIAGTDGFCLAMQQARWLEVRQDGLFLPSWEVHNSDGAKARAMGSRRQQRHASRKTVRKADGRPSGKTSTDKKRVEKRIEPTEESVLVPSAESSLVPATLSEAPTAPPRAPLSAKQEVLRAGMLVWEETWKAQHGNPWKGWDEARKAAMKSCRSKCDGDDDELRRVTEAFLAAPPFVCRENPTPLGLRDNFDAVRAGLNGRSVRPKTNDDRNREALMRSAQEL